MATSKTNTVNSGTESPESSPAVNATPENTPLPGGGSWHWDATLPGWAENAPYGEAAPLSETAPQPITE